MAVVDLAPLLATQPMPWPAATGLALFDLDRTMVRGSSLAYLGRALAEARLVGRAELTRHLARNLCFALRGAAPGTAERLQRVLLEAMAGREQAPLVEVAEAVGPVVAARAYPGARWLLDRHRAANDRCVLLSASPQELVDAVAQALGFDTAVGTVAEVVDGRYTGLLAGPFCHGEGKLARLRDAVGPVGLSSAVAYADAASDAPLLRACGSPVAVNPDARLRSLASASGWPILRLH
jgi:HAD superfamily hydrolase (TIGR01490 family)